MDQDGETYRINQRRQNELVITAVVFTSLSILAVSTRTFLRAVMLRKFGADDWAMLGALVCCCQFHIPSLLAVAANTNSSPAVLLRILGRGHHSQVQWRRPRDDQLDAHQHAHDHQGDLGHSVHLLRLRELHQVLHPVHVPSFR